MRRFPVRALLRRPLAARWMLVVFATLGLGGSHALAAETLEFPLELSAGEISTTTTDLGARLVFPEARHLQDYGQPKLPYRHLQVLIPRDRQVVDVELIVDRRSPLGIPGVELEVDRGQQVPDLPVLREDTFADKADTGTYPPVHARLVGDQFQHGYHLVGIDAYLVQQDRGTGQLWALSGSLRVTLAPREDDLLITDRQRHRDGWREAVEERLASRVANPEALAGYVLPPEVDAPVMEGWGKTPSFTTSPVDFVIITNQEMESEFQRLADHRTQLGRATLVVTMEDILANYRHGLDTAETVRMFLQDAYSKWGVDFALLGGDSEVIPPRYATSNFYPPGGTTDIPADLYYACLDGTWNDDGDAVFGEPFISGSDLGDLVDLSPELSVGRAPVTTLAQATIFVDKVLEYEVPTNLGYQAEALFASEVLFPQIWSEGTGIQLDGATFSEDIVNNMFPCDPFTGWNDLRYYENDTAYPGSLDEIKDDIIASLNTGNYGVFNHIGHGFYFNMSVGDANLVAANTTQFTNAPNYFWIYALNCSSAAFDFSCLLERFVQVGTGGAVASIGSTRSAFPNTANNYQQSFYNAFLCQGSETIGEAVDESRLAFTGNTFFNTSDRWTHFVYTLLGDPSMRIWSSDPRTVSIAAPGSVDLGDNSVTITVTDVGAAGPYEGVTVALTKDGEDYAVGETDGAGQVVLPFAPETLGNVTVWVSGNDAYPTSTTIPVADPGAASLDVMTFSFSDDNTGQSLGNGNGRLEPGERIEVTPMVRNGGTGAFGGGTAILNLNADPYLTLVDGNATVGSIGAGGSALAADPFVIDVGLTLPDGHEATLTVVTDDGGANSWNDDEVVKFEAAEIEVLRIDIDDTVNGGNGNGIVDLGEQVDVIVELKNFGAGAVQSVTGSLNTADPDVIFHDANGAWGAMTAPLDVVDNDTARFTIEETDVNNPNTVEMTLTDDEGRVKVFNFDLRRPNAVGGLAQLPSFVPGEIKIGWLPSTDADHFGYRVYRKAEGETEFSVVSPDVIVGSALFIDTGLTPLSFFEYRVVAVDNGKLEGPVLDTIGVSSAPAEISCFPLPLGQETSSDLAVWNLDDDGVWDMVIGADHVYVIDGDCLEKKDGDGDSQTFGPIENVAGKYGPASIALGNMDGEHLVEIVASSWDTNELYVFDEQGNVLPGWPVLLQNRNWSSPAIGDLDNDGDLEIVTIDVSGWTYAFHHDGTEVADGDANPSTIGPIIPRRSGENFGRMSPALYDVDNDGQLEILYGSKFSSTATSDYFDAVNADGTATSAPGWPYITGPKSEFLASPTIADIDNDGIDEILNICENDSLYIWEPDGTLEAGWPKRFDSDAVNKDTMSPSIAVGDFFGNDGILEIVVMETRFDKTTRCNLIDINGTNYPGWPKTLDNTSEASPVVGDINGDGLLDIVFGIGGQTDKENALYAWNRDGTLVKGFPIILSGFARSSATIGDFNQDGNVNVMLASWDKQIHVWDMEAPYDRDLVPWPTFRGNVNRNGVFDFVLSTAAPEADTVLRPQLLPNVPNPFNPSTRLAFEVPEVGGAVRLEIFDAAGRRIRTLVDSPMDAGRHQVEWNGRDDTGRSVSSGIYYARLAVDGQPTLARKMALLK